MYLQQTRALTMAPAILNLRPQYLVWPTSLGGVNILACASVPPPAIWKEKPNGSTQIVRRRTAILVF